MEREYALNTAGDLGRQQVEYLRVLLDPHTTQRLEQVGIRRGMRCVDVGAGAGSITRWLADQVGPDGAVVAVDLDTDWLTDLADHPAIEVHQHDINTGLPVDGPFDLIHVRLVMMHLGRRREILRRLVEALAPGGTLVVGDFTGPRQRVVSAPTEADRQLFLRVQEVAHAYVAREFPISYTWAHQIDESMSAAGLIGLHTTEYSWIATGGDSPALLNRNYVQQLAEPLATKSGLTRQEVERYCDLMLDPRFRAWFYSFICVAGRRPRYGERG
jgi:2-polyprenyl-3-methyl-5-hydroxy-6-metoxy-1,4-benzoquinol methylase